MVNIKEVLFILMAHATGDYLFQTKHLAEEKGRDNYVLFIHSILYSFGILVVGFIMGYTITTLDLLIIAISHFPIDYVKARGISTKCLGDKYALYVDQLIHYTILIFMFVI